MKKYDVLIIGSGLSGLYTALKIDPSKEICILSKGKLMSGNTELAQGGIAATLSNDENELLSHIEDTLNAGAYYNDRQALEALVGTSNDIIDELVDLGVEFDKLDNGEYNLTMEGGHSSRRILHAGGDATGKEMMLALCEVVSKRANINVIEDTMALDLIIQGDHCIGAFAINEEDNFYSIFAGDTVIATGGLGAIYKSTTNPKIATGDGVAMAYRANVDINNMEFVQFHPTSFFTEKSGQRFLVSEAVRGEGAKLFNIEMERFMEKYDERMELAPRDIVSQSIFREMYDTWSDYVYLDITHCSKDYLMNRFPTIYNHLQVHGVHMEKDLVKVSPCEHYSIGGIITDIDGKSSCNHLYAVGECSSTGVHGANRLASNSLLECVVFGERVANMINKSKEKVIFGSRKEVLIDKKFNFRTIRREVRQILQQYVGIVRNETDLKMAKRIITNHYDNLSKIKVTSKYYYETLNMVTCAMLIIDGALSRKESIGCHYRID